MAVGAVPSGEADEPAGRALRRGEKAASRLAGLLACAMGDQAGVMARQLLARFGSLNAVMAARPEQLLAAPGMSRAGLSLLLAAREARAWLRRRRSGSAT